jgi:hypothetical protein
MGGKHLARVAGRALVLSGLLSSFAACAPATPLSKQAKATIRSVSINPEVAMPVGVAWGCVPDWLCREIPFRQLTSDLGQVLHADFKARLTQAGVFPSVVPEGAEAEFTLSLLRIAFQMTTGMCGILTHCYTPMMVVDGVLQGRDGTLLWRRTEEFEVHLFPGDVPKRALATYQQQPELLRQDFVIAVRVAAERLVNDLRK